MSSYAQGQLSPDGRYVWDGTAWIPALTAPFSPPPWVSTRLAERAGWLTLGACVTVGLLADQFLRVATFGLGATAMLAVAALALAWVGRVRRAEPLALIALAVVFAMFLTVRASPWLVWPDLALALALLGTAASIARRGSFFDLGLADVGGRVIHSVVHMTAGAAFALRPLVSARHRIDSAGPLARGLLIAAPIAAVLCALLASADAVFASFLNVNVDLPQLVLDILFVATGLLAMAWLLRLVASEPLDRINGPSARLGRTEAIVVTAVLDAIFAAFALAQVLAASGAAASTLRAAGVTYSDYARNGFFQLLWVAGITLVVLIALGRMSKLAGRGYPVLALIAIALTLLIVAVAFRRLSLYEEAYGFTMLRLYSHIFAVWVAAVFILLAADLLGVWRRRKWLVGATAATAVAVLLALNVVNPEALVVSLNVDHARATHKVDSEYLASLSSDATPALVGSQMRSAACSGPKTYSPALAAFNWADQEAAAARRAHC